MILTRAEYLASISSLLPDNATQEISPLDVRTSLINLVDSVHNFMDGKVLNTKNFASPDIRTTKAGDLALSQMFLAGRSSVDNSALGYASLRNNYNGSQNTAVGSYALSCNLYGSGNTAVGYQALVGNVTGSGNVGVGNHTMHHARYGNYNIAVGHGAGWYYGPNQNYRFVLGSFPVVSGDFCDVSGNPITTGDSPLMIGNLQVGSHQLGIGTSLLHSYGMLQVSGDVSPTTSGNFNLGRSQRPWKSINENIWFSGGNVGVGGMPSGDVHGVADGQMTVYGDLVPNQNRRYALGHPQLQWDAYLNDVVISGQLYANDIEYNTITECLYECKTLHLATSGLCDPTDSGFHNDAVCGFLNDQGLDGAGFEIHSSGGDYRRDYHFLYRFPDPTINCLPTANAYTKSRWESNISIETVNGASLIAERHLGRYNAGMVIESGCMGIFLEPSSASGQRVVVAQEPHFDNRYATLQDVNFIARSGTDIIDGNPSGYDFTAMYGTVDSGVKLTQQFASRIRGQSFLRGFRLVYHDTMDKNLAAEICVSVDETDFVPYDPPVFEEPGIVPPVSEEPGIVPPVIPEVEVLP